MTEDNQSSAACTISLKGLFWLACVIIFSLQESWCKNPDRLSDTTEIFDGTWGLSITWCAFMFLYATICFFIGLITLSLGPKRLSGLAALSMAPFVAGCSIAQLYFLIEANRVHTRGLTLDNLDEFCTSWNKSFIASMINLTVGPCVAVIGLFISMESLQ